MRWTEIDLVAKGFSLRPCAVTDVRVDWDSHHIPTTTIRLIETDMRF